jgi:hypothetical protein
MGSISFGNVKQYQQRDLNPGCVVLSVIKWLEFCSCYFSNFLMISSIK